jgi:phosphate transport system protein
LVSHFEATLQRDIDRIRGKVVEMQTLAERALRISIQGLRERNRQLAYSAILRDQRIDELEKEIDRLCLEFIVRQQPVARTLRFAYAAIKINSNLERVGDYAESMGRQLLVITSVNADVPHEKFTQIADLAIPMLRDAVKAFVSEDAELARKAIEAEDAIDRLRHQLNAELVQMQQQGRVPLEALSPLMTIVNRLERVGDQAKNICQEVLYLCTGQFAKHLGSELYRVLFVDEHNSCRSVMAEAIGQWMGLPRFVFASAGVDPRPLLDGPTSFFLKEKGIDVSQHKPRSVQQVPHIDHYQIIVALAPEARSVFPPPPTKCVCLDWSVRDPSRTEGNSDAMLAAFEKTYQFLHAHIRDLVEAIRGDESQ